MIVSKFAYTSEHGGILVYQMFDNKNKRRWYEAEPWIGKLIQADTKEEMETKICDWLYIPMMADPADENMCLGCQ